MPGNKAGGSKAAETNRKRYGENYYEILGRLGGKVTGTRKGFASSHERAIAAGRKGGSVSRRTKYE